MHALSTGSISTDGLISHRFPIHRAAEAYEILTSEVSSLGILLNFPGTASHQQRTIALKDSEAFSSSDAANPAQPVLGVIGAGNYASRILIPSFAKAGANFQSLVASNGIDPVHLGNKFGFRQASTDVHELLCDPICNTIVIATRHDRDRKSVV